MDEQERTVLDRMSDIIKSLDSDDIERLLIFGEGMAFKANQQAQCEAN